MASLLMASLLAGLCLGSALAVGPASVPRFSLVDGGLEGSSADQAEMGTLSKLALSSPSMTASSQLCALLLKQRRATPRRSGRGTRSEAGDSLEPGDASGPTQPRYAGVFVGTDDRHLSHAESLLVLGAGDTSLNPSDALPVCLAAVAVASAREAANERGAAKSTESLQKASASIARARAAVLGHSLALWSVDQAAVAVASFVRDNVPAPPQPSRPPPTPPQLLLRAEALVEKASRVPGLSAEAASALSLATSSLANAAASVNSTSAVVNQALRGAASDIAFARAAVARLPLARWCLGQAAAAVAEATTAVATAQKVPSMTASVAQQRQQQRGRASGGPASSALPSPSHQPHQPPPSPASGTPSSPPPPGMPPSHSHSPLPTAARGPGPAPAPAAVAPAVPSPAAAASPAEVDLAAVDAHLRAVAAEEGAAEAAQL